MFVSKKPFLRKRPVHSGNFKKKPFLENLSIVPISKSPYYRFQKTHSLEIDLSIVPISKSPFLKKKPAGSVYFEKPFLKGTVL